MTQTLKSPIRRRSDGSIDTGFYAGHGLRLRRAAIAEARQRVIVRLRWFVRGLVERASRRP